MVPKYLRSGIGLEMRRRSGGKGDWILSDECISLCSRKEGGKVMDGKDFGARRDGMGWDDRSNLERALRKCLPSELRSMT